jgi:hypothetical protein
MLTYKISLSQLFGHVPADNLRVLHETHVAKLGPLCEDKFFGFDQPVIRGSIV